MSRHLTTSTETYMTPKEMAERLRVSHMTIYRLIHEGKIRYLKVGGSFRISESAYEEFVKEAER